jgi:hypothetical protein
MTPHIMNISSPQSWINSTSSTCLTSVSPSGLADASGTSQPGCTLTLSEREESCVCSLQPVPLSKRAVCVSGERDSKGGAKYEDDGGYAQSHRLNPKPPLLGLIQNDVSVPITKDAGAFSTRVPATG